MYIVSLDTQNPHIVIIMCMLKLLNRFSHFTTGAFRIQSDVKQKSEM